MFSAFKARIRRRYRDFRTVVASRNRALLVLFLYSALHEVATPSACAGWFRKYIPR